MHMRRESNSTRNGGVQAVLVVASAVLLCSALVLVVYWFSLGPPVLERRDPSEVLWGEP